MADTVNKWDELRKPFEAGSVGQLPKVNCGACTQATKTTRSGYDKHCDKHVVKTCAICKAWMTEAHIHLDYVGHAAVTDRLNTFDPFWTWEPVATTEHGAPALDTEGNLWIRLTIKDVTRLGVGDGKDMKERVGDALRNAAMRFGVALDLWTKDELESNIAHPENKNIKQDDPFPQDLPIVDVNDDTPISNISKDKVRRAFASHGVGGKDVTNFCIEAIGLPQPTTESEAQTLIVKLSKLPKDSNHV